MAGAVALAIANSSISLVAAEKSKTANSPCQRSLDYLSNIYRSDQATRAAFDATYEQLKPLPLGYSYSGSRNNPWKEAGTGEGLAKAVEDFYRQVCTLLPQIVGTNDNALDSIQYFSWIYYHNEAGRRFVQGIDPNDPDNSLDTLQNFLKLFSEEYKAYMDSNQSTSYLPEWIANPRTEISDYQYQDPSVYESWNAFFARNLKFDQATDSYPMRPVTMPDRDYVVVSPTDCIMNPLVQVLVAESGSVSRRLIDNPLQQDTVLDVKGIPISLDKLLAHASDQLKSKFSGGTGLACVLMPNTYHHFHSPVDGVIRHAEVVEAGTEFAQGTFGYDDWPNWVPIKGNVGRPGTDFSQFQGYTRGVIIIEVTYENLPGHEPEKLTGYVASIPVGLDTVGSVVLADGVEKGAIVKKGVTKFGNFFFGGSLNILVFSPIQGVEGSPMMVNPAVQTRMGNQIAIFNTPYPAPSTQWTAD